MLSVVDYASSNDPFCAKQPLPEREVLTQSGQPQDDQALQIMIESCPSGSQAMPRNRNMIGAVAGARPIYGMASAVAVQRPAAPDILRYTASRARRR